MRAAELGWNAAFIDTQLGEFTEVRIVLPRVAATLAGTAICRARAAGQAARRCLLAASALSVLCVIDPDPPLVLFPPLFCAALVLGCPHRVFSPVVNVVLMVYPPTVYCLAARAG